MLLAYVDESYNSSTYWIAALLCPEASLVPLTEALDDVCQKAADSYIGVSPKAELHGHDLFQGKGDWASLKTSVRARIGVYNDAFSAIASVDLDILIRGVDRARLDDRYTYPDHPHSVVLAHLLERIDERSAQHYQSEPVLVIADEVDRADQYRRNLWHFQRYSTTGYRSRRLTNIVDTIHFAPSAASRLVQAADLIAFLRRKIIERVGQNGKADRANAALWSRISDQVVHQHCWRP
jgi:hypothetical protein